MVTNPANQKLVSKMRFIKKMPIPTLVIQLSTITTKTTMRGLTLTVLAVLVMFSTQMCITDEGLEYTVMVMHQEFI